MTVGAGALQAEFVPLVDRHAHCLVTRIGNQRTVWLRSLEGTSQESAPVSPPFQDLNQHALSDGAISLLAVGKAGSNHWSLAVDPDHHGQGITFDVACRAKLPGDGCPSGVLGSCYQIADEVRWGDDDNCPDAITLVGRTGRLRVQSAAAPNVATAILGRGSELLIRSSLPEAAPNANQIITIRWRYHVQFFAAAPA